MRLADTNIFIYSADASPEERQKRTRASDVLKEEEMCLSVQVFREFYHQATRPMGRLRMTQEQPQTFLDPFVGLPSMPVTRELFNRAAQVANRYGISYWDAVILAAAVVQGCDGVYSEDLNEGQSYDGMLVIHPFR